MKTFFLLQWDKGSSHVLCISAYMHAAHMAAVHNVEFDESEFKCFFFFSELMKKSSRPILWLQQTPTHPQADSCVRTRTYSAALILDLFNIIRMQACTQLNYSWRKSQTYLFHPFLVDMLMIRPLFQSSECVKFIPTLIRMSNILIHPESFAAKIRWKKMLEAANMNFDCSWQIIFFKKNLYMLHFPHSFALNFPIQLLLHLCNFIVVLLLWLLFSVQSEFVLLNIHQRDNLQPSFF